MFEEVRRIVINNGRSHPQRNMTAQAHPEYTVENGAGAWRKKQGEPKNNFTKLQDPQISVTLEERCLDSCLKSMGTCRHVQNQARRIEEETRTAYCSNASLPRVKESRWQQQTGADGRSVRPRRRETSSRQTRRQDKKKRANRHRNWKHVAQQREGSSGHTLADFATLPPVVVKIARA